MSQAHAFVRLLLESEWEEASALVWEVFSHFEAPEYPPEGIEAFRRFIEPGAWGELVHKNQLRLWGYFCGGLLTGVGAVKGNCHISLLFVRGAWHRTGCGSALMREMLCWCARQGAKRVTVNAAPAAVGFYKKMGFVPQQEEQMADGIRFMPMARPVTAENRHGKAW